MPRKAQQEGIEGVVRAQIRIKGGAMMQYKCVSDPGGEVVATQEFSFKLE